MGHPGPEPGAPRRAGRGDLDRLAALWTALLDHHAASDAHLRRRPDAGGVIRDLLRAELHRDDRALFVWDEGGEFLGFCSARIDRAPPILEERHRGEIADLFVREDARRRGLGRALAGEALAWLAAGGVSRVEIRVATRNAEGQAFWRALGFTDLVDVLQRHL